MTGSDKHFTPGVIIAAPGSGSGKTTITLGLIRHLYKTGFAVSSAKVGPDYIDPGYHSAAGGRHCYNLDAWAMQPGTLSALVDRCKENSDIVIVEGVMGLFDGAANNKGSTADIARFTGWPVILVVDAKGMAASAAALVQGFASFQPGLKIAGVVFNRIGGPGHEEILRQACASTGIPVIGCLPRNNELILPERHLGLVQAQEHDSLDRYLDSAADQVAQHIDTTEMLALTRDGTAAVKRREENRVPCKKKLVLSTIPPLGRHVAIARDNAFAFCYPFQLEAWHLAGCHLSFFSPLQDESPASDADAVFLPGGYPELYAAQLKRNQHFINGLRKAAARGTIIYGECGGYMVLGESLTDAANQSYAMAGLLPVHTSFARRRLNLGYRRLRLASAGPLGAKNTVFYGHEFHFSSIVIENTVEPLFFAEDSKNRKLGTMGIRRNNIFGSFAHLIDVAGPSD